MRTKLYKLQENITIFEDNKIKILQLWIKNNDILKILANYNITKEVFIKNYAFGILDYYIGVVNGSCKIGDCPTIDNLLKLLRDKNIGTNELFSICSGFKNALIKFMYDYKINSLELQNEIIYIYERNFEGVLKKYSTNVNLTNQSLDISKHLIDENIIMSTTDTKGIILSASTAFCNLSGYSKDELIGKPHSILRHEDMSKEIFYELWETIKSGNIWKGEVKNLKKDGGFYWVFATISPNLDKNGNIIGYAAIRQDITSKKEVANQQDLLIEQSKAAAMGEMIAMLAHQWRQPLQATAMLIQQLTLEKMIDGTISDETLEKVTSGTQKQIDYMSKTIDDFRDFFKPDKHKDKIRVARLIEKARELIAYTLRVDNIELIIDIKDDIEISVHVNEIVQVLINLVKNASDILIEKNIDSKKILVTSFVQDENIIIQVKDNAGGVPDSIIGHIFDAYFSTKKNKNGTGLGLYMSKNIIENHGRGLLSVRNENGGAVFKITLPIE